MAINPFLIGSLTSIALVNAPHLPAGRAFPSLSEEPHWISALGDDPAYCAAQPARATRSTPRQDWGAQLAANTKSLSNLPAGWDGPGSMPISASALSRAVFYVNSAMGEGADVTSPRLVPGGDGSVQIEWHTKHGELEFDIDDRGAMSIWIRNHLSEAEFNGEGAEALVLFYRWASWIASRQSDAPNVFAAPQMAAVAFAA